MPVTVDWEPLRKRLAEEKTRRIADLCRLANADLYFGPSYPYDESKQDREGWRDEMRQMLADNAHGLKGAALVSSNLKLIRVATCKQPMPKDWNVPLRPTLYPGFSRAVREIRAWWSDCELNGEVWHDTQSGEWLTKEPQGWFDEEEKDEHGEPVWHEPFWEDYFHFEAKDVAIELFGRELAHHIR